MLKCIHKQGCSMPLVNSKEQARLFSSWQHDSKISLHASLPVMSGWTTLSLSCFISPDLCMRTIHFSRPSSTIICSNKFSISCSSSSPPGTPRIHGGMFKVVPEVPKPLLIFLNSCFFILFQLDVYFLLVQIADLSFSFLPRHCWFPAHFPSFHLA